jgi:hypothetical protein
VRAGPSSNVALVLKNLEATDTPLIVLLNDGAELILANDPVPEVQQARIEKWRAGSKKKNTEESPQMDSAEDWCGYFSMVALQSNPTEAVPCKGKPDIPSCTPPLLTAARRRPHVYGHGIQTIACSSSQYP